MFFKITSEIIRKRDLTCTSGSTEVALASCSSKGKVQARVTGSPVVGWTDTVVPSFRHSAHCRYWPPLSLDLRLREYVLFHAHTTASATETFLLPSLECGRLAITQMRRDMNYRHFKHALSLKGHMLRL